MLSRIEWIARRSDGLAEDDRWFGLETKPDFEAFQRWWHRVGKEGKDLTNKADADKAYAAFKADKTTAK